jgi:Rad3-related DNA helicase
LSRFQIIAKVPFPNLGDKYISVKKDLLPKWYAYQTAKTIVQSYGRSVRNENDYAVTYILDSDF